MSRAAVIISSFFLAGCGDDGAAQTAPPPAAPASPQAFEPDASRPDRFVGEDGVTVILAGVRLPEASQEAAAAAAHVAAFREAAGSALVVETPDGGLDRYGRRIAQLRWGDRWLQAELVELGLAAVSSLADPETSAELAVPERSARANGRGGWATGALRAWPASAEALSPLLYSEQIVEGIVLDAAEGRDGRVYLNFGPDWRTDFTVMIRPEARPLFDAQGLDPLALAGARVEVRGWLVDRNGPMIELSGPAMLSALEDGYANPLNSPG